MNVKARLWERRFPEGCTAEGIVQTLEIELDEPLGDRRLAGEHDACGTGTLPQWLAETVDIAASDAAVAAASDAGVMVTLSPAGEVRWTRDVQLGRVAAVGHLVLTSTAG